MIIDSHCHLDYAHLFNQLDDVVKRAEINQVKYLLTICTTLESFEKRYFDLINTMKKDNSNEVEYLTEKRYDAFSFFQTWGFTIIILKPQEIIMLLLARG